MKIKRNDTIVEVTDDYKLQAGETVVTPATEQFASLSGQMADAIADLKKNFSGTKEQLESLEKNLTEKFNAEISKIVTKPAEKQEFTFPKVIMKGKKTFGLNPESNAGDYMAIRIAAGLTKEKHGSFGKYEDLMKSDLFAVTLTEGTAASVGILVLDEWETEIMQSLGRYGGFLSRLPIKPTNSDTINLRGLLTGPTVTVGAEASSMPKTDFTVSAPIVHIKEARAYMTVTNALAMDAPSLRPEIDALFLEALRKKIETDVLNSAAGATEFGGTGVLGNSSAQTEATATTNVSSLNYDDFVDAESKMDDVDLENAIYLMHRTIKGSCRKVKNDDGDPIFQQTVMTSGGVIRPMTNINGYPVVTSLAMPSLSTVDGVPNSTFIALFDPAKIVKMYLRQGMSLDLFTQGTDPDGVNHNITNTSGIRLNFRAGFETHVAKDIDGNATGLVLIKTAAA